MKLGLRVAFLLALSFPVYAADVVVPIDTVKEHVNVRMWADAKSEIVGRLRQGESMKLERNVDGWYEVALDDGAFGYVHADWAYVISEEEFASRQQAAEEESQLAESAEKAEAAIEETFAEIDEQVESINDIEATAAGAQVEETVEVAEVEAVQEPTTICGGHTGFFGVTWRDAR